MKALVIEAEEMWREIFEEIFVIQGYDVLLAASVGKGEILFDANGPEISLVIVDGFVNSMTYNSGDLIRYIRSAGYEGIMVGASGSPDLWDPMVADGCNMAVRKDLVKAAVADLQRA